MAGKAGGADAEITKILQTMSSDQGPWANKQIAEKAGLDAKAVSNLISKLKKQGLVDSPVRCKYAITEMGLAELKK
ncbi:hypothetical protein AAU61_19320 [Desulfocarbo indianensis]|nr:hypothetical protein AAU61_19320 [Desulfocarbo indianensis]